MDNPLTYAIKYVAENVGFVGLIVPLAVFTVWAMAANYLLEMLHEKEVVKAARSTSSQSLLLASNHILNASSAIF